FGFGLSYTSFAYDDLRVQAEAATDGRFTASVTVRNTGEVAAAEIVQLYGRDPVASVTRPVAQLLGYARVQLAPGEQRRVHFDVPAARFAFSDRRMVRVVEPGELRVWAASHAEAQAPASGADDATGGAISNQRARTQRTLPGAATAPATVRLTGAVHEVTGEDARLVTVSFE